MVSYVKITITGQLAVNDAIEVQISTPLGTQTIREQFVNSYTSPRPAGFVLLSSNLTTQANYLLQALQEDYSALGYATFSVNGNVITIEAVNECESGGECREYTAYTYSQTGVGYQYEDCETGEVIADTVGGASGFDGNTFCARINTVVLFGAQLATGQPCTGWTVTGSSTFDIIELPVNTDNYTIEQYNNLCTGVDPTNSVINTTYSEASSDPCNLINVCIQTQFLLIKLGPPTNNVPNFDNPICLEIPRNEPYILQGTDNNGTYSEFTIIPPPPLSAEDFSIVWENSENESVVTIINEGPLTVQYNMDGGAWQTGNVFILEPGTSHVLNVRDEYGCEIAIPFDIDDYIHNEPVLVSRYLCNSLHELNVGKYLNLCGKQHTMKIGFVTNVSPNTIKIFKHVQMVLNVDYAIKNVLVKTSQNQERFIPGNHLTYRIRESMHSVPLKNPYDYDDLRGSWAYIELEIESIDNQKVDLFSVITHLRKSTI